MSKNKLELDHDYIENVIKNLGIFIEATDELKQELSKYKEIPLYEVHLLLTHSEVVIKSHKTTMSMIRTLLNDGLAMAHPALAHEERDKNGWSEAKTSRIRMFKSEKPKGGEKSDDVKDLIKFFKELLEM